MSYIEDKAKLVAEVRLRKGVWKTLEKCGFSHEVAGILSTNPTIVRRINEDGDLARLLVGHVERYGVEEMCEVAESIIEDGYHQKKCKIDETKFKRDPYPAPRDPDDEMALALAASMEITQMPHYVPHNEEHDEALARAIKESLESSQSRRMTPTEEDDLQRAIKLSVKEAKGKAPIETPGAGTSRSATLTPEQKFEEDMAEAVRQSQEECQRSIPSRDRSPDCEAMDARAAAEMIEYEEMSTPNAHRQYQRSHHYSRAPRREERSIHIREAPRDSYSSGSRLTEGEQSERRQFAMHMARSEFARCQREQSLSERDAERMWKYFYDMFADEWDERRRSR